MEEFLIHRTLWTIVLLFSIVFISFNFTAIYKYKHRKLKEDIISLEKFCTQIIVFIYFLSICLINLINDEYVGFNVTQYFLIPYFVVIYMINSFIAYEKYKQIKDPSYTLRSYVTNKKMNFTCEAILLVSIALSMLLIKFGFDYTSKESAVVYKNIFILFIVCFTISLIPLYFYFAKKKAFSNYLVENKKNAVKRNQVDFVNNLMYFFLNMYFLAVATINFITDESIPQETFRLLIFIGVYLMLSVSFLDIIFFSFCIYKSDFYYYTLGNSSFGYAYRMFGNEVYKKPILSVDFSTFNANIKENSVLYFHTNLSYMIEEYLIDTFDNLINVSLASLHLIFDSFSSGKSEISTPILTRKDNSIDFSNFLLDKQTKLLDQNQISTGTHFNRALHYNQKFHFEKEQFSTDERLARLISFNPDKDSMMVNPAENAHKHMEVNIESLHSLEFIEFIRKRKISLNRLKESLISHLNPNSTTWNSLLSKNCKEYSFKKQKKLLLNTYDRFFSFEICSDDSIFAKSDSAEDFLRKYFDHMNNNTKSFLPLIVGVFKIQINNFKEIVIVVTKNIVVQEDPKEFYNYWQLMRLNKNRQMEMLTSSKDRTSTLIKDEILFRKDFKLTLGEFNTFEEILKNDIEFLRKMKTNDFSLLIMYYELSKGQSLGNSLDIDVVGQRTSIGNNFMGAIRISVISSNRLSNLRDGDQDNQKNFSPVMDSISVCKDLNLLHFKENNGFEAAFNNFKCVLFFVFDNVFDTHHWCHEPKEFYEDYTSEIMNNFDESTLL